MGERDGARAIAEQRQKGKSHNEGDCDLKGSVCHIVTYYTPKIRQILICPKMERKFSKM